MTALSTTNFDFILTGNQSLSGAVPCDMRDAMMRILLDMGFTDFIISNSAPANRNALWWHKDVRQAKRYAVASGNWIVMTPDQFSLHMAQRFLRAAQAEGTIENGDLFPFYDVSAGETKKISRENLATALGFVPGVSLGDGVFVKVAEKIITAPTATIDLLNVIGYKQYMVRAQGLRITPELGYNERADLYMQLGNNSTLYASNGDYFDVSKPYLQIYPHPTSAPNLISNYAVGEGIFRPSSAQPGRYAGVFMMFIRHLNSASRKTRVNEDASDFGKLLTVDEDSFLPDGQNVEGEIRTAATAENRIRYLLAAGKQFTAGRISVFGIN